MPDRTPLREDAERIWRAGVDAVLPERLLPAAVRVDDRRLLIESCRGETTEVDLRGVRRLIVVGGGKAGAGMARGLEAALGADLLREKDVAGLVSVPGDCVGPTERLRLVGGRPAGVNEPRPEGARATAAMLRLAREAAPDDLVLCLLSGGGSALLTAPTAPLTIEDKVAVARRLAEAGATIDQLNTVRQQLSDVKGGGLARACNAGRLVTLVVSDVLGDPLDLIASGPTIAPRATPADALAVLADLRLDDEPDLAPVVGFLKGLRPPPAPNVRSDVVLLANNALAVDAAGMEAERLGYRHAMTSATASEGAAEAVGEDLARMALSMRDDGAAPEGPNCLISGGEPTVKLAPKAIRGLGGRNQQLALAVLRRLGDCRGVALVAGGTDGEDGPTDAAGAVVDAGVARRANDMGADTVDALRRNDAYRFFEPLGGLLMTGPTHTNVCDLRVVTVETATASAERSA